MAQQEAIYDQNCRLIVSYRAGALRTQLTTCTPRTQVRLYALVTRWLTHTSLQPTYRC